MSTDFRFIELFAGIGLVRLGLEAAGWSCAYANDIDEKKRDGYNLNFPPEDYHLQDVWEVKTEDVPRSIDLLTASFPCTDLSLAGYRRGLEGSESSAFWGAMQLAESLQQEGRTIPGILLENVLGFMTSHGGADFRQAMIALNNLGYVTDAFVLDASRFAAQSRPRLFVVALQPHLAEMSMTMQTSHGILDEWSQALDSEVSCIFRPDKLRELMRETSEISWGLLELPSPPTIGKHRLDEIVVDMPRDSPQWWNEERTSKLICQMSVSHRERLQEMQDEGGRAYGTVYRRMRHGKSMAELRRDGLAGCLRTPKGGSSRQILVAVIDGEVRARLLNGREYGRLQGVPDTFKISSDETQACFGFGDAVCVPAVTWIGKNVLNRVYLECQRNTATAAI